MLRIENTFRNFLEAFLHERIDKITNLLKSFTDHLEHQGFIDVMLY